ncbi:MAG TPA: alpha-amylase family glycosyl hydrolase, partial [Flavisolibacter sp.]|nr:alpha-amylase family glycosyl hydrolase [Flavisolibacter sp.]
MFKNKFILLILTTSLLMSCSRSLHQQGTASNWFAQSNIYEVNLRQYTASGTIKEFQTHLPRLRAMGVEILWFMPVTPIGLKERKMTPAELGSYYAVRNYTAINPEFGTMADWKALVNDAHQRGFKVIIDWVPNHTAADHPWLTSNPDFYEKDAKGEPVIPYDWTDVRQLDYSNKKLRDSMFNAIKFWVQETGVDGFRVDQAFKIDLNFWQRTIPELNKIRSLFWLAESDPAEHTNLFADGLFHAGYTWKWMHKTREFYQNKLPLSALEEVLQTYNNSKGIKMWFTSNHDENSWNGTEFEKYGAMADALAVFSSTWKGIPLIYSGQEVP